ncbi:MAG: hypothetical protein F6K17_10055 [Okeania sp. SIO3C4]|nr:hypothetical protein [Okeania sp. SIO3C4]
MLKNHKLASAIADCGFYEFKRQLTYKCEWYGSELYHVRLNTYTLEEGRQKAEGRRQKERKGYKGKGFFITDYPDMILHLRTYVSAALRSANVVNAVLKLMPDLNAAINLKNYVYQ